MGMAEGRGSVGGSKCSVVVAVERAVVSVSMLELLCFLGKMWREWWLRRRRSRKESGLERPEATQGSLVGGCGCVVTTGVCMAGGELASGAV